jgi:hypothetical protein
MKKKHVPVSQIIEMAKIYSRPSPGGLTMMISWPKVTTALNQRHKTKWSLDYYRDHWLKETDPERWQDRRDANKRAARESYNKKYSRDPIEPYVLQENLREDIIDDLRQLKFALPTEKYDEPIVNETYSKRLDGTTTRTKNICLGTNDIDDDRAVMTAFGLDPDKWVVLEMTNSRRNQSKDPDKYWYNCRIRTKPMPVTPLSPELILERIKEICPVREPVNIIQYDGYKAVEIVIPDVHTGAFSWQPESGEMYDYAIIRKKFNDMIGHAKAIIEQEHINKLYLCFLGDFLHIDNSAGTTAGGTSVDHDGRFKKMVDVGFEIVLHVLDEFSAVPDVEVHWVEGNHSRDAEYVLFDALPLIYRNRSNFKFNISRTTRTAFLFGKNLVGLIHGDMPQKQKFNWIQLEYPTWWSESKYREIHEGHTHKEGKEVDVASGITLRTCMTPKNTDKYEYVNGWLKTPHGFMAFVWDAEYGLESIRYFR